MRTELPNLTRCCFCLPLRHGLLFWGYTALVASIFLFSSLLSSLVIKIINSGPPSDSSIYAIVSVVLFLLMTDIAFNIVFIIGGHKKKHMFIRIYYFYKMVQLAINTLLFFIYFCIELEVMYSWGFFARMFLAECIILIFYLLLNAYILLLVRSEMIKFRNSCKFEFTNNAADMEAQCNLDIS